MSWSLQEGEQEVRRQFPQTDCVIPVTWFAAYEWLSGDLDDRDLLLKATLRPEGVFLVNFSDRAEYKSVLRQIRRYVDRGAKFLIARTSNPVVDRHMTEKNLCLRTWKEATTPPAYRLLAPPEVFLAWCAKWGIKSPAARQTNSTAAT